MPWLQHRVASTFLSPYLLSDTEGLSEVNVVSAFYTICGACSIAAGVRSVTPHSTSFPYVIGKFKDRDILASYRYFFLDMNWQGFQKNLCKPYVGGG